MLRILTVTLNPALDQVYEVADFAVGKLNRPASKTVTAGGKGINVARAYQALGGQVMATGLAGGSVGRDIVNAATNEGIPTAFVSIAAEGNAARGAAQSPGCNSDMCPRNSYSDARRSVCIRCAPRARNAARPPIHCSEQVESTKRR